MENSKHRNFKLTLNKLKFNLIEKSRLNWQQSPHELLITDTVKNIERLSQVNNEKSQEMLWESPIKVRNLLMDNGNAYHSADTTRLLLKSEYVADELNFNPLKQDIYTQCFIDDS